MMAPMENDVVAIVTIENLAALELPHPSSLAIRTLEEHKREISVNWTVLETGNFTGTK